MVKVYSDRASVLHGHTKKQSSDTDKPAGAVIKSFLFSDYGRSEAIRRAYAMHTAIVKKQTSENIVRNLVSVMSEAICSGLVEKFKTGVRASGGYFPVYINPDKYEIKEILADPPFENTNEPSVRIGFSKTGALFAWHYAYLHSKMEKLLSVQFYIKATVDVNTSIVHTSCDHDFTQALQVPRKAVLDRLLKAFPLLDVARVTDELMKG